MHLNKTVVIINIGGGLSNELRGILEYYGYLVVMHNIGRPQHFIELLQGKFITKFDYIIIDCHGIDGKIIMPKLGDNIYFPYEPRGNFGVDEINKYLNWNNSCVIINGCSTGTDDMAEAFVKNNNTFIAPNEDIKGDSDLVFTTLFFYYLTCGFDIETAHKKAFSIDSETNKYIFRKNI